MDHTGDSIMATVYSKHRSNKTQCACSQARYLLQLLMDGHIELVKFGAKRVPLFTSLAFFTFFKNSNLIDLNYKCVSYSKDYHITNVYHLFSTTCLGTEPHTWIRS